MLGINLGSLDCHRTVDVNWKRGQSAALKGAGQEIQEQLRSTHGKNGNKNLADCLAGPLHDLTRLNRSFLERPMISIAVGRFHEDDVRMLEGNRIAVQRRSARAEVTGENYHLLVAVFLNGHFDTHRTQHMTRLDHAD